MGRRKTIPTLHDWDVVEELSPGKGKLAEASVRLFSACVSWRGVAWMRLWQNRFRGRFGRSDYGSSEASQRCVGTSNAR